MKDFPMQDSISTSKQFFTRTVFIFFGFNIVCQLLARQHSNEIKTMKYYSDRLKPFFAQNRPSFTCTYLALVFSVSKWKSILVKKLAASKKKWWILITHHALLKYTSFLDVDKRKKNKLIASERFQFGIYIRIITKKFYQVTQLMTDFPMQDSKSTFKQFFNQTVFYFFLAWILFVSFWLVTFQKR